MDQPKAPHPRGIRKSAIDRPRSGEPKPSNRRIVWARGLSDKEIGDLLQMKLLESRAARRTEVPLLNELVHEIKHRISGSKRDADT